MSVSIFDLWRMQSDFRRFKGRASVMDWIFFRLRNWWLR